MTTQEYLKDIQDSQLSDATKKQIAEIIGTDDEITEDSKFKISLLIQKDIEDSIDTSSINQDELKTLNIAHDKELAEVATEFEAEMTELENEAQDLEAFATELDTATEEVHIATIKADLAQ